MRTLGSCAAVLVVGCYSPHPPAGAPCSPSLECPSGQSCDVNAAAGPTCVEPTGAPDPDALPGGGEADPNAVPSNDRPEDAIDISGGGQFPWALARASDDIAVPCAAGAGPDVFFTLTLEQPEVVYLDTFGSTGDPVIAVQAGPCTAAPAAEACVDNACGEAQAQGAFNLPAGTHCVIVDHVGPPQGDGTGVLSVVRSGRIADPLVGTTGTVSGDTSKDTDTNDPPCGCGPSPDHRYFFAVCPGQQSSVFSMCEGAMFDTVLQVRKANNSNVACNDDSNQCPDLQSRVAPTLRGPGLFFVIVDGCDESGPYTLSYQF